MKIRRNVLKSYRGNFLVACLSHLSGCFWQLAPKVGGAGDLKMMVFLKMNAA